MQAQCSSLLPASHGTKQRTSLFLRGWDLPPQLKQKRRAIWLEKKDGDCLSQKEKPRKTKTGQLHFYSKRELKVIATHIATGIRERWNVRSVRGVKVEVYVQNVGVGHGALQRVLQYTGTKTAVGKLFAQTLRKKERDNATTISAKQPKFRWKLRRPTSRQLPSRECSTKGRQ